MQIDQTSISKRGSKKSPYKEGIVLKNLSSMIEVNPHGYPEIQLNKSDIFFSGSEDSYRQMNVISTKFNVKFDYNLLFKDAFENCMANQTCRCMDNVTCLETVPNLITIVNTMQDDFVDSTGLSRSEMNELQNEWVERALYDQNYTEVYRLIF